MSKPKPSALFQHIERQQNGRPWGSFLDAGTGVKSISWVATLATERWTAITAAPQDAARIQDATQEVRRPQDKILLGNWAKADLLKGETYDTVLADYLLGAVEGFAPYFQSYLLARLRPMTGKILYLTGAEPYVPSNRPTTEAGRLVWEIGRFRDACLLLSGELPYREYPSAWVSDQLKRSDFSVQSVERFPNRYKANFVTSQIDLSLEALKQVDDETTARALSERGERLRANALALIATDGALAHGYDYVIAAEPV